jgi:hypothetical protein
MWRSCLAGGESGRATVASIALALLAACAREPSEAEKRAAAERAIAQVEAVQKQKPPPRMLAPHPILFADIDRHGLYGAHCAFAPGDSMGAVLLARDKAVALTRAEAKGTPGPSDGNRWDGHLTVTDAFDQVVYDADGLVQCNS